MKLLLKTHYSKNKMKKLLITLTLIIAFQSSQACDICGCGVGGNYIGLLPDFTKRFVGLRYQFNRLTTQLDINGNRTALSTDEKYQTMELWGAWNIGQKWRVLALVPYNFNEKYSEGSDLLRKKNGIGDITLNGYYKLFDQSKPTANNKLVVQSLWVGMGVKLPTGAYDVAEQQNATATNPNMFQLGTGSLDFIPSLMYDVRIQDFGINANASYKINTENKDDYRYGNKIAANASAYYKIALGTNSRLAPNAGISFENQQKDHAMGFKVEETGGHILNASMGLEANFNRISVGASFQTPIQQELGRGRIDAGNRLLTHVSFSF